MGLRFTAAKAIGAASTWGLRNVMGRNAATMPGKFALKADPDLLSHLRPRLHEGSVLVVGTNGKTSVTNLLADALEAAGKSVVCNRTGANLSWGVASSLLQTKGADWGVFETDELWIARVLPHLKSDYVVLLNLFDDQMDRFGEMARVQASIVETLKSSPETVLVYNADDPRCAGIAAAAPNRNVAFGVNGAMSLAEEAAGEAEGGSEAGAGGDAGGKADEAAGGKSCQQCQAPLSYRYRQYSQLGDYFCPACGFTRPELDFAAESVEFPDGEMSFDLLDAATGELRPLRNSQGVPYLVYNLLAVAAASCLLGIGLETLQRAIEGFNPRNGRLQRYLIQGRPILLNLAKNPTGFNQNIGIIARDENPKVAAFLVNNMEGDGRDPSWIDDANFEELAGDPQLTVLAGGMCKAELQERLKRAGLEAQLIEGAEDALGLIAAMPDVPVSAHVYFIANYTALPPVHDALDKMEAAEKSRG